MHPLLSLFFPSWRWLLRWAWRFLAPMATAMALNLAGPGFAAAQGLVSPVGAISADEAWVAQLAEAQGPVWLLDRAPDADGGRSGRVREWLGVREQGLQNWPLSRGDRVRTDGGGRATVRVASVTVRLDQDSELELVQLDADAMVFRLWRGQAAWHVLDDEQARRLVLVTSATQAVPQRAGHYRLETDASGSVATSWRGELRLSAEPDDWLVGAGRSVALRADGRSGWRAERGASLPDAFAERALAEARADAAPQSARHVSGELSGWQALERQGEWRDDAQWGTVWVPRSAPPGWAPYRDGRWGWVAPWGWTWIDAAPWGFVTFHYGQWVPWQGAWAWAPSARDSRPRFQPVQPGWQRPAPPRGVVPPRLSERPPHRHDPAPPTPAPWPSAPWPSARGEVDRPDMPTPRVPRVLPPRAERPERVVAPPVQQPMLPAPAAAPEVQQAPALPRRPDRTDRSDRPEQPDRAARPERPQRADWPARPEAPAPSVAPPVPMVRSAPPALQPAPQPSPQPAPQPEPPRVARPATPPPEAPRAARPAPPAPEAAVPTPRSPREGRANEATR